MDRYFKGSPINGVFTITEGKERLTKAFISVVSKPDDVEMGKFAYPAATGFDDLTFNSVTGELIFTISPQKLANFTNGHQLFVVVKMFDSTGSTTEEFEGGLVYDAKTETYGAV